jgi:hypothetical protein
MSVEKVPSSKLVIGSYIVTLLSYLMIWFSIMILNTTSNGIDILIRKEENNQ